MGLMDLINKYLITEKCCLCTDIRTGGLILGIVNIVFSILLLLVNVAVEDMQRPEIITLAVFQLILSACFVYGIVKSQAKFLLPDVIISIIGFGIFLVAGAILTVFTCGLALIIFVPLGALNWNLTAVKYSLYLKIDDENMRHPGAVHYDNDVSPS